MSTDLRAALESGEALRYETALRGGGRLGLTDERVLVTGDSSVIVPLENVDEVTIQSLDWFLVVLSVVLLGVAAVSFEGNPPLAAGFVLVAVANGYLTYGKRNRVRIQTHTRPKPVSFSVDDPDELYAAFELALAGVRERE